MGGVYQRTIKKKRIGGVELGNQKNIKYKCKSNGSKCVLDRIILQENMLREGLIRPKQARRFRDTGCLSKKRSLPKLRSLADEKIHLSLTCQSAFEAMYLGKMPFIYDQSGILHSDYAGPEFDVPS